MKSSLFKLLVAAIFCCAFCAPSFAASTSMGNYQMTAGVVAGAGSSQQSAGGYTLLNVGLQVSPGTGESSSSTALGSGGLYTLLASYGKIPTQTLTTLSITLKPKNVPNPFKTSKGNGTTIMYNLQNDYPVKLIIYDISGRAVWTRFFNAGSNGGRQTDNEVFWDGTTDLGQRASNGVYIYLITTKGKVLSKGQMAVID